MKTVNLQCVYEIPDEYSWIARNRDGILCGFRNPPIRDYIAGDGEWIDSTDGSYGEIILFVKWEVSVREVKSLRDCIETIRDKHKSKQVQNTTNFKKRGKNGKA